MRFTDFIWNLYKDSIEGNESISLFESGDIKIFSEKFSFEYLFELNIDFQKEHNIHTTEVNFWDSIKDYTKDIKIKSLEDARIFFEDFIFTKGIPIKLILNNGRTEIFPYLITENLENSEFKSFFEYLEAISFCLFKVYPEHFFPYLFDKKNFFTFLQICENFNITIPLFPPKNNWIKRIWYYFDLCVSLMEFRRYLNLKPNEFAAFIYDFGVKSLKKIKKDELPQPAKVWFVGAGDWDYEFLDNADESSTDTWGAGNERIKSGDIIIMYCTNPRKCIHSIWRAISDSFINPFAYYYYLVNIGFPMKINPIGFQTLASNSILKENSTVKAKMQGLNGKPLNQNEYSELIRLIKESGIDTSDFPKLTRYNHSTENINDERDVEIILIEPLLKRIGLTNDDWMRQMPIRMGRGVRYFPDYAVFFNCKRGEETAKIIIEAKYEILTDKQLEEAYIQAKSYAIRLQSYLFIIADKNCLYLFEPIKNSFELANKKNYFWSDLDAPDVFHSFKERFNKWKITNLKKAR